MNGSKVAGAAAVAILTAGLIAPLAVFDEEAQRALGLTLFAVVMWTARPVPVELSSLVVLLLLPATGLLDFAATFDPFARPTIWLVFSGMVLSLMLSETGLGHRLASVAQPVLTGGGPLRLFVGLHLIGLLASFLIPSGLVRVLLLMPIGISLAESLSPVRGERSPAATAAITLALLCSTYYGGCGILTGSVPNLVVTGQLEAETGRVIYWGEWLVWMFPVFGALRTALCLGVVYFVMGRGLATELGAQDRSVNAPLEPAQRRALAIIAIGIALWATDVVHGLPPVYVGLLLCVLAVLPGWGPLSMERIRGIDFPFFFYLSALFGIGEVLHATGVNDRLLGHVLSVLDFETSGGWLFQHLALTLAVIPLNFFMDVAAVGAVVTPTILQVGSAHGVSELGALFSTAMATTLVFLPYQAAPFMVALGYRAFSMRALVSLMLLISLISLILLCPFNITYWHWLGLI
ncbi:MAG: SLC13 family permease [Candidatus Latescibacterota bacterium]|nr:SLC13 family permease [Candidatus Latescibacterota bacterium]